MAGSLSALQTGLSALRHHQVAMDVASQNIANVSTEGYTRRRAEAATLGAPTVPALWSRNASVGDGVTTSRISRFNDALLDARSRTEHGSLAYLETRATSLTRLETGVAEPSASGVAAALADFRSAWSDLANDPSSAPARSQVLARGVALGDAFAAQAVNVAAEQSTQRATLLSTTAEVNTTASELADVNRALSAGQLDGGGSLDLADQRDKLALRLADLTGATTTLRPDGQVDVSLGGVSLVNGARAGTLEVTGGVAPDGSDDGAPVTLAVTMPGDAGPVTTALPGGLKGRLGGTVELLTTTLPAYRDSLAGAAANLADRVNTAHAAGYDASGAPGQPFFAYDPANPAGSLAVAVDRAGIAASSLPGGGLDGGVAAGLAIAGQDESEYQRLVTGLGTQVASVQRLAATQSMLTTQVDSSREQLAGVNLDEEMVSMLSSQRAYEAAARVMTVVDSMLDTLINRTGMVR